MLRTRKCVALAIAFVVFAICQAKEAAAIVVNPGQTLDITFSLSGPPSVPGFTGAGGLAVDTLQFIETDHGPFGTHGVAQLFNGSTLLGSVNFIAGFVQSFAFVAPGSAFTFPAVGTVSDWSSITSGAINGILKITLDHTIDFSIASVYLGVANGSSQILLASPGVTITGAAIATPLPAALPLFATGAGVLGLIGWRRKRKAAALA